MPCSDNNSTNEQKGMVHTNLSHSCRGSCACIRVHFYHIQAFWRKDQVGRREGGREWFTLTWDRWVWQDHPLPCWVRELSQKKKKKRKKGAVKMSVYFRSCMAVRRTFHWTSSHWPLVSERLPDGGSSGQSPTGPRVTPSSEKRQETEICSWHEKHSMFKPLHHCQTVVWNE